MSRLERSIQNAAGALRFVKSHLDRIDGLPIRAFPEKVYEDWKRLSLFSYKLDDTIPLILERDLAEKSLYEFDSAIRRNGRKRLSECVVKYGSIEMPIAVARDMALATYVMQTWVIYDRIANVAGRLVGPFGISRNEMAACNPKLLRYFVQMGTNEKPPLIGSFSIDYYLKYSYAWQILAASRIRNCIIHDGGYINSNPFFTGDSVRDLFVLNADAATELKSELEKEAQRTDFQIIAGGDFFNFTNADIRPQLKLLHEEIDCAVSVLIGWACDAFLDLVRHFSYLERGPVGTVWL